MLEYALRQERYAQKISIVFMVPKVNQQKKA